LLNGKHARKVWQKELRRARKNNFPVPCGVRAFAPPPVTIRKRGGHPQGAFDAFEKGFLAPAEPFDAGLNAVFGEVEPFDGSFKELGESVEPFDAT
jgi:hypothetical protein